MTVFIFHDIILKLKNAVWGRNIMKLLILSDIHSNLSAFRAVMETSWEKYNPERVVLLGDHIDYGMRPNELIRELKSIPYPIDINIWGNHEKAIMDGELSRFSSDRGRGFSKFTSEILTEESREYILKQMQALGKAEMNCDNKKILCVHGSLQDCFWKSISAEQDLSEYCGYDYVLSGHSHVPSCFDKFYAVDSPQKRNKKKTTFINPGSVGQPRNHSPRACYAVLDTVTGEVHLDNAEYDFHKEQELYGSEIDVFYKTRIEEGI